MDLKYQVVYSARRSLGLEIRQGNLIIRAPRGTPRSAVEDLIRKKQKWILEHLEKSRKRLEEAAGAGKLSAGELQALAEQACRVIPERVRYFAPLIGVKPGRIAIRCQKTRWGSCSTKGNLNFNCLLMLAPEGVIDSIVVHELCHLKHMNHSKRFYAEIEKVLPDYRQHQQWLKENGEFLLARVEE